MKLLADGSPPRLEKNNLFHRTRVVRGRSHVRESVDPNNNTVPVA